MGMDADVIVIGPYKILKEADCLDYPKDWYNGTPDALVICTVAIANTTQESKDLALICNVNPYDVSNHQVKNPVNPDILMLTSPSDNIGNCEPQTIYETLSKLLDSTNVKIFYRPN